MDGDHPGRKWSDVLAQHDVGCPDPVEQPVLDHGPGPRSEFFGRLEDHHHPPGIAVTVGSERGCRPEQTRDVHVVTAGMHHGNVVTEPVHGA
jgi:hypothetical protein